MSTLRFNPITKSIKNKDAIERRIKKMSEDEVNLTRDGQTSKLSTSG